MSVEDTPKQIANAAAAAAPVASYLSGLSVVLTIVASIISIVWMGSSVWKTFFPDHFEDFVKRINRKDEPDL